MESQSGSTFYGRCKFCGKNAVLDNSGICQECENEFSKQSTSRERAEATPQSKRMHPLLPTWKIISAFNSFYKFFKTGGIIICSILAAGWLLYCMFGAASNEQDKIDAAQNYMSRGVVTAVQPFNPHWEVIVSIILILIGSLFLAYFSQAVAKVIEKITEIDYKD